MVKKGKFENSTKFDKYKSEIIPIVSLIDLAMNLANKQAKNIKFPQLKILQNCFYFQLVDNNNNESLDIYYIFDGTILYDFFYHISITRNDQLNYLSLLVHDDKNKKIIDKYQIGPFYKNIDGNILDSDPIKEIIIHLVNLQKRFF